MDIENKKWYVIDQCRKSILSKSFNKKIDAEREILQPFVSSYCYRRASGRKLNNLIKKGINFSTEDYNKFKERIEKRNAEEKDRIERLKREGNFYED